MPDTMAPSAASQAAAARLAEVRPPGMRPAPAAADAQASPEPTDEEKKKAKKKKRTRIILLCVLVLLVGYVVKGKVVKPHYAPGQKVPAGVIISLGSVTTNLADGHLAQIGISLQMTKAANAKKESTESAALVGSTVALIGQETYGQLLPAGGRSALQAQLLRSYQQILGTNEGAQQISAVYFTSFVLQ